MVFEVSYIGLVALVAFESHLLRAVFDEVAEVGSLEPVRHRLEILQAFRRVRGGTDNILAG